MRLHALAAVLLWALAASAHAQQPAPAAKGGEYAPTYGEEGKDVIWVPTPDPVVDVVLDMARLKPDDLLVDLGSGDGRIVIAAARRGFRAVGIEYNEKLVEYSIRMAEKAGVSDKTRFVKDDIFTADLSSYTVIVLFLRPKLNMQLLPRLTELKPGTRVISHRFLLGEWKPDEQRVGAEGRIVHQWIVPAKVEGNWDLHAGKQRYSVRLAQKYQQVSGTVKVGAKEVPLRGVKLEGASIRFTIDDGTAREFAGRVAGNAMEGATAPDGSGKWTATRRAAR
jgi:predicted O-methyltransferase YrrM